MSEPGVYTEVLENGLTLIGEVNPSSKSAAIGYFVSAGSRDEDPEESGVSHFLEHMMFKGTEKRTALDITYAFGNIGAQSNAFTSDESTVYYAAVVPEYFSVVQELFSDMLRPLLDEQEFETEKKVILEEIALYQDRPHYYLFEKANLSYFNGHPAGNSVLGTEKSIQGLTNEAMRAYFHRRYSPHQLTLVAAGAFDWDQFCRDAREQCGSWSGEAFERGEEAHVHAPEKKVFTKADLHHSHVLFISPAADYLSEHRYSLALLSSILGDSQGSKIYWSLVDKGLVDSAGADSDQKLDTGTFGAYASTDPQRISEVAEILSTILNSPLEFSEEDLERVKTKIATRIVLSGELPMGRLMALGSEWSCRRRIHSLKTQLEEVSQVTTKSIHDAVECFGLREWSEFRLVPEE
jgi:predicted Zn-dependent peptidase